MYISGVILILSALACAAWLGVRMLQKTKTNTVCIGSACFDVEIADNMYLQAKGLMNRTELSRDSGMLFVFATESPHRFWMKNTLIPLDMIWADEKGVITYIEHNAQPCAPGTTCANYGPTSPVKYVLEINGGLAQQMGIAVGDTLKFPSDVSGK